MMEPNSMWIIILQFLSAFVVVEVNCFGLLENVEYKNCFQHSNEDIKTAQCNNGESLQRLHVEEWMNYRSTAGLIRGYGNLCLVVDPSAADQNAEGVGVKWNYCADRAEFKWKLAGEYYDTFQLESLLNGLCLTASTTGSLFTLHTCATADNKQFFTIIFNKNSIGAFRNFGYSGNLCLKAKDVVQPSGAELKLSECVFDDVGILMDIDDFDEYGSFPGAVRLASGLCLTVKDNGNSDGDLLVQEPCSDDAGNQVWKLIGNAYTRFQLKSSTSGLCMTSEANGAYVDQWRCVLAGEEPAWKETQFWKLQLPKNQVIGLLTNLNYPEKCIRINGGNTAPNERELDLASCGSLQEDEWIDIHDPNDNIEYMPFTPKCLTILGNSNDVGAKIVVYDCNGGNNQKWNLIPVVVVGDGSAQQVPAFQLQSDSSHLCITAQNNGAYLDQQSCADQTKQQQ